MSVDAECSHVRRPSLDLTVPQRAAVQFDGAQGPRTVAGRTLGGLPLAEIIWQARNQDQHYNDAKPTHTPTLDCFRVLTSTTPITFGLSGPPDEGTLNDLVKQQSWAPEILNLLGWVTAKAAGAGISSIRP